MRIMMIGAGGVGGYFGARLLEAGRDLVFVARGRHLEAIVKDGLFIASPRGDLHLPKVPIWPTPAEAGRADLVLIAVKLGDTQTVMETLQPVVADDTIIVSLQNGVDAEDMLVRAFGSHRVMGGVARISAAIEKPGHIRQVGRFARVDIGELDGSGSERLKTLADLLSVDGMDFSVSTDIRKAIWEKFVFLATMSAATATARSAIGPLLDLDESRSWLVELVSEASAVARAEGIALAGDFEEVVMSNIKGMPREMIASMAHDLANGKPLELDWLSGAVVRLAVPHGLEATAHRHVVAALAPHRSGARA